MFAARIFLAAEVEDSPASSPFVAAGIVAGGCWVKESRLSSKLANSRIKLGSASGTTRRAHKVKVGRFLLACRCELQPLRAYR